MNKDKESLDSKINRYREECKRKTSSSSSDGMEQFTELVEYSCAAEPLVRFY